MLCFADSYFPLSPSYYGYSSQSWIDHVIMPKGVIQNVSSCSMMVRAARRLQVISDNKMRDHVPIRIVIKYDLRAQFRKAGNAAHWDHDKIAEMYQTADGRELFLADINKALAEKRHLIEPHYHAGTANDHDQALLEVLLPIARQHFTSTKAEYKNNDMWRTFSSRRDELMKLRQQHRMEGGDYIYEVLEGLQWCTRELKRLKRSHWASMK